LTLWKNDEAENFEDFDVFSSVEVDGRVAAEASNEAEARGVVQLFRSGEGGLLATRGMSLSTL